jgi:hypothetical protein
MNHIMASEFADLKIESIVKKIKQAKYKLTSVHHKITNMLNARLLGILPPHKYGILKTGSRKDTQSDQTYCLYSAHPNPASITSTFPPAINLFKIRVEAQSKLV